MNYFNPVHYATRAAFSIMYVHQASQEKESAKAAAIFQKVWGGREIGRSNSQELANYRNRFLSLFSADIPQETICSFLTLSECFALSEVSRKTRNAVFERLNPRELIRDWTDLCEQIEREVERTKTAPMQVPALQGLLQSLLLSPFCRQPDAWEAQFRKLLRGACYYSYKWDSFSNIAQKLQMASAGMQEIEAKAKRLFFKNLILFFDEMPSWFLDSLVAGLDPALFPKKEKVLERFLVDRFLQTEKPGRALQMQRPGKGARPPFSGILSKVSFDPEWWFGNDTEYAPWAENGAVVPPLLESALVKICNHKVGAKGRPLFVDLSRSEGAFFPFSFIRPLVEKLVENPKICVGISSVDAPTEMPLRVFCPEAPLSTLTEEELFTLFPEAAEPLQKNAEDAEKSGA